VNLQKDVAAKIDERSLVYIACFIKDLKKGITVNEGCSPKGEMAGLELTNGQVLKLRGLKSRSIYADNVSFLQVTPFLA
jgi:hypothetical protein